MKCPKCGKDLIEKGNNIYYCSDCDYEIEIKPRNGLEKPKKDIWIKDVFEKFPSNIAHEYHRLYEVYNAGNRPFETLLQIRDVYEVTIKFFVLSLVSDLSEKVKEQDIEEVNKLFEMLFSKPLSLGDWVAMLFKIKHLPDNILKTLTLQPIIDIIKE